MSTFSVITLLSAVPIVMIVSVISYILYSMGLYGMADHTGINSAFFAWIPGLRLITVGQAADRYNDSVGKQSMYRVILPSLRAVGFLIGTFSSALCAAWATGLALPFRVPVSYGMTMTAGALAVLAAALSLATRVCELICYYKIFCDYEPSNAVLYEILCILQLEWVAVFLCRNNVPVGIAGHCRPRQPRYQTDQPR